MRPQVEYCALSDIGLKRKKNDDFYITALPSGPDTRAGFPFRALGQVFAVADGMGGHPAGDVAARMACETFIRHYFSVSPIEKIMYSALSALLPPVAARYLLARLERAMDQTDQEIQDYESRHARCEGLGTTLSVLVLNRRLALIAHVGDSRIYRLRDGELEQLTVDHTFVQDLVDMGDMTREEASTSPMRHVLMQALGQGYDETYTWSGLVKPGDTFLLCSDGLNDMISSSSIKEVLESGKSLQEQCMALIQRALAAGGKDNVTVMVVKPLFQV